jgi:hypothetical protein
MPAISLALYPALRRYWAPIKLCCNCRHQQDLSYLISTAISRISLMLCITNVYSVITSIISVRVLSIASSVIIAITNTNNRRRCTLLMTLVNLNIRNRPHRTCCLIHTTNVELVARNCFVRALIRWCRSLLLTITPNKSHIYKNIDLSDRKPLSPLHFFSVWCYYCQCGLFDCGKV